MREASKSGGALGSVSDYEGQKLESALGSLEVTQSKDQFIKQLGEIQKSIITWEQAMVGSGISVAPNGTLIQIVK